MPAQRSPHRVGLAGWPLIGLTVLLAWVSPLRANSQEDDLRTLFADAEYFFLFQEFLEALPLYLRLHEANPQNSNVSYRIGRCYLGIPGLQHKALPFLQQARLNINPNHQEGLFREEGAPIDALFYLGEAYRLAGRTQEAIEAYTQFRMRLHPRDVINADWAQHQIQSSLRASEMVKNPIEIATVEMDLFQGRHLYKYNPVKAADGQSMIFTAREKFYYAVYWVNRQGEQWGTPVNITLDLGVEGEIYTSGLSADGAQLLLCRVGRGTSDIYHSRLVNGRWQRASPLGQSVNSRDWETHASFSADGQMLLFTSNRRGGMGGLDIYYSIRQPNGEWGPAVNMGPTINTPHNEESPYICPQGQTLTFTSQGHNTMGGYDIFTARRMGPNEWATPTNMGYPINTPEDNMFYHPLSDSTGLVARVPQGNPAARVISQISVVRTPVPTEVVIVGRILLDDGAEVDPGRFTIALRDTATDLVRVQAQPLNQQGDFRLLAQPGAFRLEASGQGYTPAILPVVIPQGYALPEYPVTLRLIPARVTAGQAVVIRSILFAFDSHQLSHEAKFELEKLYNLLVRYPSLTLQISGHTDHKGSAAYNLMLSRRRAMAVIHHLTRRGIDPQRLTARAASLFEDVAANFRPDGSDSPEGRRLNRRVSVSVVGGDPDVRIQEYLSVPEHLRPRPQRYTVLIQPVSRAFQPKALDRVSPGLAQEVRRVSGPRGQLAYTIGSFPSKSESIDLIDRLIAHGFTQATVIGEQDLVNLLQRPHPTARSGARDDQAIYTIELMARSAPICDPAIFQGLTVTQVKGDDGLFRYIHGEFRGADAAYQQLQQLRAMGFEEAVVMNIMRYR